MKFNEYLSVLVYKLVLVINLINGKILNDRDKNGEHGNMIILNSFQRIAVC
jgi:hypothetical protein